MRTRLLSAAAVSLLASATVVGTGTAAPAADADAADTVTAASTAATTQLADADGDALPDDWEANGYDANGDGTIDVDLPGMGASPNKKDLFVEMDYMAGRLASTTALDRIVDSFAQAPVANPDGTTGVRIHLDAGAARGDAYNLGGGNEVPYDARLQPYATEVNAIKDAHFAPARQRIFHYMIWADSYTGSSRCSSGVSLGIPADTFIVTVGPDCGWNATDGVNAGTFIHELGHNLGLTHGGTDHVGYKPNYLSVMNYFFQMRGVPRADGSTHWGYSTVAPPTLDETRLDEASGLGPEAAEFRTKWTCPDGSEPTTAGAASGPIDWNCDGDTTDIARTDINKSKGSLSVLTTQDNWENITFGGGNVGAGAERSRRSTTPVPEELTVQQWREMQRAEKGHVHDDHAH